METDNTDLNEEFMMPDLNSGVVINSSEHNGGELLVSEPPSAERSCIYDFSIEDDNQRESDSSCQSLSNRV